MILARGIFVHTAGPNVALIKSSGRKDVRIVIGGRMFAIPILQRVDSLSLALRTITVQTKQGLTVNGVSVDVTSACQVKIQGWNTRNDATSDEIAHETSNSDLRMDYAAVRLAAQHFLGKAEEEINETIEKTIAGHQRAIIGVLTVEELYRDRREFRRRVLELISSDMRNMGLIVVSYTVAEISDVNGYIAALGVTQTEIVKREAAEGLASNQAQARLNVERQKASSHIEVNRQEELKLCSDKELQIAKAKAEEEVQRRMAVKAKAHDISSAEQDAILFVEQQKARAAETQAELAVLKQQVEKEKLLKQRMINVEADANLYRATVNANAMREAAKADADRVRMTGLAEAEAIQARGAAEVNILRERNRAWQESINSGAILERIIDILPRVAEAIASPLKQTEKMVFVGSDGRGGPSQFFNEMTRTLAQVPEAVGALTGVDLVQAINNLAQNNSGPVVQGAAEGFATAMVSRTPQ